MSLQKETCDYLLEGSQMGNASPGENVITTMFLESAKTSCYFREMQTKETLSKQCEHFKKLGIICHPLHKQYFRDNCIRVRL